MKVKCKHRKLFNYELYNIERRAINVAIAKDNMCNTIYA